MIDWSRMQTSEMSADEALKSAQVQARALLNIRMAKERARFITTLPGQEMIYLAKEAEAVRYVADPIPDLTRFPMLAAEIGITAPDAWQLAQIWLAMADLWREAAAQLEAYRLRISAEIDAAESLAEIPDVSSDTNP